jgi:hypothetical protein
MTVLHRLIGTLALAGIGVGSGLGPSAWAASSAVASASDSVSTSVDSLSRSIRKSSDSSSRTVVGQGDYQVIQVAELDSGQRDVTLQAVPGRGAQGVLTLRLPPEAAQRGDLVPGRVVTARERPYGIEFARADTRTAFFLLLDDAWYRELQSVALPL